MKTTILAIVGASGSGKTYMAEYLKQQCGVPTIVSFTTRPKRSDETDGVEHWFVDTKRIPKKEKMLASTIFGGYAYWTEKQQLIHNGICTYVIDEDGLKKLEIMAQAMDLNIIPLLVKRDESYLKNISKERRDRDKNRNQLPNDYYKYIIENNGTLKEFHKNILLINKEIKLWQHQK